MTPDPFCPAGPSNNHPACCKKHNQPEIGMLFSFGFVGKLYNASPVVPPRSDGRMTKQGLFPGDSQIRPRRQEQFRSSGTETLSSPVGMGYKVGSFLVSAPAPASYPSRYVEGRLTNGLWMLSCRLLDPGGVLKPAGKFLPTVTKPKVCRAAPPRRINTPQGEFWEVLPRMESGPSSYLEG